MSNEQNKKMIADTVKSRITTVGDITMRNAKDIGSAANVEAMFKTLIENATKQIANYINQQVQTDLIRENSPFIQAVIADAVAQVHQNAYKEFIGDTKEKKQNSGPGFEKGDWFCKSCNNRAMMVDNYFVCQSCNDDTNLEWRKDNA
jgi:rubrerythrin